MTSRFIVCGSRGWTRQDLIADRLFWLPPDAVVVHGAARGADRLASREAAKLGLVIETHPADWERHGRKAGVIRNWNMARLGAELCLAFWDGRSYGTYQMMGAALHYGISVEVVMAKVDV
jgi:hypothetical protein